MRILRNPTDLSIDTIVNHAEWHIGPQGEADSVLAFEDDLVAEDLLNRYEFLEELDPQTKGIIRVGRQSVEDFVASKKPKSVSGRIYKLVPVDEAEDEIETATPEEIPAAQSGKPEAETASPEPVEGEDILEEKTKKGAKIFQSDKKVEIAKPKKELEKATKEGEDLLAKAQIKSGTDKDGVEWYGEGIEDDTP